MPLSIDDFSFCIMCRLHIATSIFLSRVHLPSAVLSLLFSLHITLMHVSLQIYHILFDGHSCLNQSTLLWYIVCLGAPPVIISAIMFSLSVVAISNIHIVFMYILR